MIDNAGKLRRRCVVGTQRVLERGQRGLHGDVTAAIWGDMPSFEGYLSHELLVDADDPGHLLVVSQWASRAHADESLRRYAAHPNAPASCRSARRIRRADHVGRHRDGRATGASSTTPPDRAHADGTQKIPAAGANANTPTAHSGQPPAAQRNGRPRSRYAERATTSV